MDIAKKEIDNMLTTNLIYLVDQSEWANHMVIHPKKHDPKNLRVFVDFQWLKQVTLKGPFPTPFTDEIINEVLGHKYY